MGDAATHRHFRGHGLDRSGDANNSIERAIRVLADSWSLLIIREVILNHTSRYSEFLKAMPISTSQLAERLARLVNLEILELRPYQDSGQRARHAYFPTDSCNELKVVLVGLQQWGDRFLTPRSEVDPSGEGVRLSFITDDLEPVATSDVNFVLDQRTGQKRPHVITPRPPSTGSEHTMKGK